MKTKQLILTAIIAVLSSLITIWVVAPTNDSAAHEETAYERVMRTGVLRCGYFIWPPFHDLDPNTGELSGVSYEMEKATAALLGLDIEFTKEVIIGQGPEELRKGEIDAICGDGAWVITTTKFQDYTDPFFFAPVYAYGRKGEDHSAALNKAGVRFIGMDGDLSQELAIARYPQADHATLPSMANPADLMLYVTTNKADYVVIDPISVTKFQETNGDVLEPTTAKPLAVYWGGFSVEKGQSDLIRMLNIGIDAANNLGIYADIMTRYPELQNMIYLAAPRYQEPAP